MAIISSEQWQKKNKKQIAQNVEQNMQNYTPAQEPNWNNYLARHEEERRQAATYDPSTGSTVRAVTAENAASTYADSKKKYWYKIAQNPNSPTSKITRLATDFLESTNSYLSSGRLDDKTRSALSRQYNGLTNYIKTWGKDIEPDLLSEINTALEQANAYLDPSTARQAYQNKGKQNGSISARALDMLMSGGNQNPILSNIEQQTGVTNYSGNFDNYVKNNIAGGRYQQAVTDEQTKYVRGLLNGHVKGYEQASRLADYINSGGDISMLESEEQDQIEKLLKFWQNSHKVNDPKKLSYEGEESAFWDVNAEGETNTRANLPTYKELRPDITATKNELGAAYDTTVLDRRTALINNIIQNDPDAAERYLKEYNKDKHRLNESGFYGKLGGYATDEEGVTYGYLKENNPEEAEKYLRALKPELVSRAAKNDVNGIQNAIGNVTDAVLPIEMRNGGREFANDLGNLISQLGANLGTIGGNIVAPISNIPGLGELKNYNTELLNYTNAVKSVNTQEVAGDNKLARILWQGTSSGIENAVELALAGKAADALGYATKTPFGVDIADKAALKTRGKVIGDLMSTPLAAGAAQLATEEGKAKGYSDDEAEIRGIATGAIEFLTEKVGMDWMSEALVGNMFNSKGELVQALKNMVASGLAEGAEEISGNWLDRAVTAIIDCFDGRDITEVDKELRKYISQGMTEQEAMTALLKGYIDEDIEAFASAFWSAAAAGVGYSNVFTGGASNVRSTISEIISDSDSRQAFIESGLESDKNSEAYRKATEIQKKLDNNEKVSFEEYEELYYANNRAEAGIADTVASKADLDWQQIERAEAQEKAREEARQAYQQTVKNTEESLKNVMGESGQKIVSSAVENLTLMGVKPNDAFSEIIKVYNAGINGEDLSGVRAGMMSQTAAKAIYDAGVRDNRTDMYAGAGIVFTDRDMSKKTYGVVESNTLSQIKNKETLAEIGDASELAQRLHYRLNYADSNAQFNGKIELSKGDMVIYLDNAQNSVSAVLGHENMHWIKANNEKGYNAFRDATINALGKNQFNAQIQDYMNKFGLSEAEADEEVVCDYAGEITKSTDVLRNFANSNRHTEEGRESIRGLRDAFRRFVSWAKGEDSARIQKISTKMSEAEKVLSQVLRETEELMNKGTNNLTSTEAAAEEIAVSELPVENKFSMKSSVEVTKDLVAIHNLYADNLDKTLDLGGFPMPSIAVTTADMGHTNFGEISIVFGRDTVDPKADKANKVYSGDAWTPEFPDIDYEVNPDTERRISDMYYRVYNEYGNEVARPMYSPLSEMERILRNEGGVEGIVNRYKDDAKMMNFFLAAEKDSPVKMVEHTVTESMTQGERAVGNAIIPIMGEATLEDLRSTTPRINWIRANEDIIRDTVKQFWVNEGSLTEEEAEDYVNKEVKTPVLYKTYIQPALRIFDGSDTITRTEYDNAATEKKIRANTNMKEYEQWLKDTFSDAVKSTGLRNQKDIFTPSGNRRSFAATHYEVTLENIVRAMKEQGEQGIGAFGSNILGAAPYKYRSIAELRKDAEARIRKIDDQEINDLKKEYASRFSEIANSIVKNNSSMYSYDGARDLFIEALNKYGLNRNQIAQYVKREGEGWTNYKDSAVDDFIELVNDIRSMPTTYFEAKPQRVVSFDEVLAAVVPNNTDTALIDKIKNAGIQNVLVYEPNNADDRIAKVNSVEGARFSFKDTEYLKLAENPEANREQLQKMVDEAAREAGYTSELFHGTKAQFTSFDINKSRFGNSGYGFYFGDRYKAAEYGGENTMRVYVNTSNLATDEDHRITPRMFQAAMVALNIDPKKTYKTYVDTATEYVANKSDERLLGDLERWAESPRYYGKTKTELKPSEILSTLQRITGYDGLDKAPREIVIWDNTLIKSADPVTYDNNGNVIPLSERFNENNQDIRYSTKDSDGKELTPAQQEYFKDSKVRDENGNLKVMYHGSGNAGFTVFNAEYSDDQRSIFFTDNLKVAESYSASEEVYSPGKHYDFDELNELIETATDGENYIEEEDGVYKLMEVGMDRYNDDVVLESENLDEIRDAFIDKVTANQLEQSANYAVYLNLTNPLIVDAKNNNWDELEDVWDGKIETGYNYMLLYNDLGDGQYEIEFSGMDEDGTRVFNETELKSFLSESEFNRLINGSEINNVFVDKDGNRIPATTRQYSEYAEKNGYDGVIFNNIIDNGVYGERFAVSNIAIAFNANQIKDINNENPTENQDIRYSRKNAPLVDYEAIAEASEQNKDIQLAMDVASEWRSNITALDIRGLNERSRTIIESFGDNLDTKNVERITKKISDLAKAIVANKNMSYNTIRERTDSIASDILFKDTDTKKLVQTNSEAAILVDNLSNLILANIVNTDSKGVASANSAARRAYIANESQRANAEKNYARAMRDIQTQIERNERLKDTLRDVRAKRDARIAEDIEKRKARREQKKQNNNRTQALALLKRAEKLRTTAWNRKVLDGLMGDLDTVAKSITDKKLKNLEELKIDVLNRTDPKSPDYDPDFIPTQATLDTIARYDKTRVSELSDEELGNLILDLTRALQNIANAETNAKLLIDTPYGSTDYRTIGGRIIDGLQDVHGIESGSAMEMLDKAIALNAMRPSTFFLRTVGYDENNPLYQMTFGTEGSLASGQREMVSYKQRANAKYVERFVKDAKFVESIMGKKARTVKIKGFNTATGQLVELDTTPDLLMALYMHAQNEQNLAHIVNTQKVKNKNGTIETTDRLAGGMIVPNDKMYRQGKIDQAYTTGNSTKIRMTPQLVQQALTQLNAKEMEFVRSAQRYYSEMSQPEVNKVSEKLLGYSLATVENYFRLNVDAKYRSTQMDSIAFDGTIANQGWTKERVDNTLPINLVALTQQLAKDIDGHSKYVGLAIPIRNFNKVYGVTRALFEYDQNGNVITDPKTGMPKIKEMFAGSVQAAIEEKWGRQAGDYIEKLMKDIQSPSQHHGLMEKIRSNYAGSVLTLNAGVAVKQAASYPTAAAVIGWAPLIKAFGNNSVIKSNRLNMDIVYKYSPMMYLRTEGQGYQEIADMQKRNKSAVGRALNSKALNWIQDMDVATVKKLWKASEYYVRDNFKGLKVGSDEYYKKVGEIHSEIIEKTQPNYTALQRGQLLRSDNDLVRAIFGMFKTQPYQNFSILYEATGNWIAKANALKVNNTVENRNAFKEASKKLGRAWSSQLVSALIFAAMQFGWDWLRKKDDKYEDENGNFSLETAGNTLLNNMASNAFGMLPAGSALYETIMKLIDDKTRTYGIDASAATDVINDLQSSIFTLKKVVDSFINSFKDDVDEEGNVTKSAEEKEKDWEGWGRKLMDVAISAAQAAGLPLENLEKDLFAVAKNGFRAYGQIEENRYLSDYLALRMENGLTTSNRTAYLEILYHAYDNGDMDEYQEIYDLLKVNPNMATAKMDAEEYINSKLDEHLKKKHKLKVAPSKFEGISIEELKTYSDALVEADKNNADPEKRNDSFDQGEVYNALMSLALDKQTTEKLWDGTTTGNTSWDSYLEKVAKTEAKNEETEKILAKADLTIEDFENFKDSLPKLDQANAYVYLKNSDFSNSERNALWNAAGWKTSYSDYAKSKKAQEALQLAREQAEEEEDVEETPVRDDVGYTRVGSTVLSGYEYHNGVLTVTLNNGRTYSYNVSQETFDAFEAADSKGSFWNNYIK